MTLTQIVEQLESCDFKDEVGHSLVMSVAFVKLKEKAAREQAIIDYIRSSKKPLRK